MYSAHKWQVLAGRGLKTIQILKSSSHMVVEVFYERFQLWKNFGVSISGRIWEVVTYRGLKILIEM